MPARHEEGRYEKYIFMYFLACKGLSSNDVGVERGAVFLEIRSGAGFGKSDLSLLKSCGGYV